MGWLSNLSKSATSESDLVLNALNKSLAVIEFEPDGTIITANQNFLAAMGYQLAEVQGNHHSLFVDMEYAGSAEYKEFWQKLALGEAFVDEFLRYGKGGKKIWISASYNPVLDRNNKVFKVVKFATDITAQKEAEVKARETANFANILIDCQANVMVADNDLNIVFVNKQVEKMLQAREDTIRQALPNFSVANLIGTCVDDFHKEPSHQRKMLKALSSPYETKLKLAGLTFELIATPWLGTQGERLGTLVEWQDVTDELAADEAKREIAAENSRIRQALDNVSTSAMVADANNVIIYMNEAAEQMMLNAESDLKADLPNFDAKSIVGNSVDVFHKNPAHQQAMLDKLTSTYKTQITVGGRTFDLIANPIVDDKDGSRIGTVVEWQDVTEELERLRKEKILAATNARVKQALDNVATCTMVADENNDIIYMNESVHNMLKIAESDLRKDLPNFNAEQILGKNIDVFHKNPAHQRAMLERLTTTYKTEIIVGGRTFSLTANPIIDDDGKRLGTVVEWLDRTVEVSIEREVEALIEAAGNGDLTARVTEDDKEGFFKQLSAGLNQIVSIAEGVITDTVNILDALAHGDLTKRIEKDYGGTFDKLKRDANATADKLTEVIGRIEEAANTVATGAEEIAQGNTDLSQRTEEQASSLEETASSMEEMTSTVRQNADNASMANDMAQEAVSKASSGGEIVSKAVSSMAEINESSKKISDIIGVIDEIAFQTNLLALNAAVEAARAGEQGRGFAVVAGEVRNLAQRSAAAAKEIKDLIRDSVTKVEDGTSLVNQSGEMLNEIVESVRKVNQTIADISVASEEQSSGIEQVNKAVAQMDEMTQQNAALVEEASAAGESMSEQARAMKQLLSFFQLDVNAQATLAPPRAERASLASPTNKSAKAVHTPVQTDDEEWEEF
ncbi:MAG: PAS domain-containing protein [Gammaproteobacteria bacterium]|nr:PAS domain-containing protein [Gammaproteobacteria bacterium]